MRLFFTTGACCLILISVLFFTKQDIVELHRLLFLTLLPAFVYGGFILTAVPDWTNYTGNIKQFAIYIYLSLWLASFCLIWDKQIFATIISLFWLSLFCFCCYLVYLNRSTKHFSLLVILLLFVFLQAGYTTTLSAKILQLQIHLNMLAIVLISFKISMMMGYQALKSSKLKDPIFIPNGIYKNLTMLFITCYLVSEYFLPQTVSGFFALSSGFMLLAKLKELHHQELLKKHYIVFYYLIQLLAGIGYVWLGFSQIHHQASSQALHLLAIASMLGTMILVMMMAGLRHSGFAEPLLPRLSIIAMISLFIAAISRSFLNELHIAFYIQIPAALLIATGLFYLFNFIPIFSKKRFSEDPD